MTGRTQTEKEMPNRSPEVSACGARVRWAKRERGGRTEEIVAGGRGAHPGEEGGGHGG